VHIAVTEPTRPQVTENDILQAEHSHQKMLVTQTQEWITHLLSANGQSELRRWVSQWKIILPHKQCQNVENCLTEHERNELLLRNEHIINAIQSNIQLSPLENRLSILYEMNKINSNHAVKHYTCAPLVKVKQSKSDEGEKFSFINSDEMFCYQHKHAGGHKLDLKV